jgi:hypothetical protein
MTLMKKAAAALAGLGLAAFALAQNGQGFHFYGPVARFVTAQSSNGGGHPAVFCFDNPALSGVTGQIFNLVGRQVDTFISPNDAPRIVGVGSACTQSPSLPNSLQYAVWDGTSNGSFVHSGIYIYRVAAEGGSYTGTLVVVR